MRQLQQPYLASLMAGLASGSLYVVGMYTGIVFFAIALPTLPLFFSGFTLGMQHALFASIVATLQVYLFQDSMHVVTFAVLNIASALLVIGAGLLRSTKTANGWGAIGSSASLLSLLFTGFFLASAVLFSGQEGQGVEASVRQMMMDTIMQMPTENTPMMEMIAQQYSYAVIGGVSWLMVFLVCLVAQVTLVWLNHKQFAIRPPFSFMQPGLPAWLFALVVISSLLSFTSGDASYLGKILLIGSLSPYFIAGIGELHRFAARWQNRPFLLSIIYAVMIFFVWPVLLPAAWGVYRHSETLLASKNNNASSL